MRPYNYRSIVLTLKARYFEKYSFIREASGKANPMQFFSFKPLTLSNISNNNFKKTIIIHYTKFNHQVFFKKYSTTRISFENTGNNVRSVKC